MSHQQPIACNSPYSSPPSDSDSLRFVERHTIAKRRPKLDAKSSTLIGKTPFQVQRRNERERRRVQQLNNGYEVLRQQVSPWEKVQNKKLTKSETLHVAIEYINYLRDLLENNENQHQEPRRSLKTEPVDSPTAFDHCQDGSRYGDAADFANDYPVHYAMTPAVSSSGAPMGFDTHQFGYSAVNCYQQIPSLAFPYASDAFGRPDCS